MMRLNWRRPDPPIITQWRGPAGAQSSPAFSPVLPQLAALIGPPGAAGPAGASALGGIVTITLPPGRGVREWRESVDAPGVSPASRVQLALAPSDDAHENDPELLGAVALWARGGDGEIDVGAAFAVPAAGPINLIWSAT